MDSREVEKTVRRHLGGDFTGKVVVRIRAGEIVACDVGSPEKPMRTFGPGEAMTHVVNALPPRQRDPDELEAEAAQAAAEESYDAAVDQLFAARAAVKRLAGGAYVARDRSMVADATRPPELREEMRDSLREAERAVAVAEGLVDEAGEALVAARVRTQEVARRAALRRRDADLSVSSEARSAARAADRQADRGLLSRVLGTRRAAD